MYSEQRLISLCWVSVFDLHVCSLCLRLAASAAGGGGEKMPSPSFTLDAQLRFHDKWLKIDLQVCVSLLTFFSQNKMNVNILGCDP